MIIWLASNSDWPIYDLIEKASEKTAKDMNKEYPNGYIDASTFEEIIKIEPDENSMGTFWNSNKDDYVVKIETSIENTFNPDPEINKKIIDIFWDNLVNEAKKWKDVKFKNDSSKR